MKKSRALYLILLIVIYQAFAQAQPIVGVTTFFTSTTTALAANTACTIPKTTNLSGWLFSVSSSSNCGFNWTNSTGGDGRIQFLCGFGTLLQGSFGSDDGSEFALQRLVWGVSTSSWTSKPMRFEGFKNGVAVPGATLIATTPSGTGILNIQTVTFTNVAAFSNVDKILLAPNSGTCNSILFFEEIEIGVAVNPCPTVSTSIVAASNVSCNGGSNGSATIAATGGTTFTYSWSPSGGTSASASGLLPGTYTVSAQNNCGNTAGQVVTITQPLSLTTATAVTTSPCNGSNGSATITPSGGTSPYSYIWSTGATGTNISALAGAYSATVTDNKGCTSIKSTVITQPSALVTSTAVTNVACNGGTGSSTIIASGGTAPYTYTWSNGSTVSNAQSLSAGSHTVKVTDLNNCISTRTVNVTQPAALATTTAVTNVACNGGNGSATITASGGAGGYTYVWSNGGTAASIAGMAGVYTATVTDANNCKSMKSAGITQPSALTTVTAVTNAACNGSNGSATITPGGGTGGYTYIWSNGATSSNISGIAGVYTATLTDANNCSGIKSVMITQPAVLVTNTSVVNVACNGGNGTASVFASGGTGPYTYLWSTAATTSVISTLAGIYTATVTDVNNCTGVKSVVIGQPSALSTNTTVVNAACNGNNGTAYITASGGTLPYNYLWSGGATTSVITNVAGVYTATVTDANNCSISGSVTISQPQAIISGTAQTGALCNGGNGSATLSVSGGTGAYNYLWSSGATTSVITNVAGVYTATITDANNCNIIKTVTIFQPGAISASLTAASTNVCAGAAAILTSTASGGTGILTYSWTGNSIGSAYSPVPTANTVYSLSVTDANNCVQNITVSIVVVQPPTISVPNYTICSGSTLAIVPSGASTYTISGGNFNVNPSAPTSYTISGTGANGCQAGNTIVATVAVNTTPTVSVNNYTICSGAIAVITASGASTYTISGNNFSVSPLITTNYSVTGTSTNGCVSGNIAISNVSVMTTPTVTVNNTTVCSGNGAVIVPSGANSYTITGNTFTVTPLITSSYSVVGTSTNGCVSADAIATISVNATPSITLNSGAICPGNSYTLIPTGASIYTISGGNFVVVPGSTTSYTLTGIGANGCPASNTAVATVSVVNTLIVSVAGPTTVCAGSTVTLTAQGAATYTWSNGAVTNTIALSPLADISYTVEGASGTCSNTAVGTLSVLSVPVITVNSLTICSGTSAVIVPGGAATYSISGNTFTVFPLVNTTYSITGISSQGCISSEVLSNISVIASPTLTVNNPVICRGTTTTIIPTGAVSYSISGGIFNVTPQASTNYSVTGTGTNGCISAVVISGVTVEASPLLTVSGATTICVPGSSTLTAAGASTYSWNNGAEGNVIVLTPSVSTSYTLSGTVGNCIDSLALFILVDKCTGINSTSTNERLFSVYPNPAGEEVVIDCSEDVSLTITNSFGAIIFEHSVKAGVQKMPLNHLSGGIYFLRGSNNHVQKVIKLIKQ